jgi:hypothetical protein
MSNVQSMLALGALIVLSLISFNFNSAVLSSSTVNVENKVALTAISLGDDVLEEIKGKSFDETTTKFPTTNPASLTPAGNLGPDSGEVYPNFNDVDDFNGYTETVSAPHAENYNVSCIVQYVDSSNVDNVSATQTFYKKATVTVTSPYMNYDVVLSFVYTLK